MRRESRWLYTVVDNYPSTSAGNWHSSSYQPWHSYDHFGTLGNVIKHSSVADTNSSDVTIADKFIRNLEEYAQEGDIVVCAVADQAASSSTDGDRAWKASHSEKFASFFPGMAAGDVPLDKKSNYRASYAFVGKFGVKYLHHQLNKRNGGEAIVRISVKLDGKEKVSNPSTYGTQSPILRSDSVLATSNSRALHQPIREAPATGTGVAAVATNPNCFSFSTPDLGTYQFVAEIDDWTKDWTITFDVKASNDVHLRLSNVISGAPEGRGFEIVIGGSTNTKSTIRTLKGSSWMATDVQEHSSAVFPARYGLSSLSLSRRGSMRQRFDAHRW